MFNVLIKRTFFANNYECYFKKVKLNRLLNLMFKASN